MKIAVLGDLHIPALNGTVKDAVLAWALGEARLRGAAVLAGAGDLIALGRVEEARKLRNALDQNMLPYYLTPGNAELRTPSESTAVAALLSTPMETADMLLLDSARGTLAVEARRQLKALASHANKLLVTHYPPSQWTEEDRQQLDEARRSQAVGAVIAGHVHADTADTLRGLDPDKASGGPPAFVMFERPSPEAPWQRSDIVMPGINPREWRPAERAEFRQQLGLATLWNTSAMLDFAIKTRIKTIELRGDSVSMLAPETLHLLKNKLDLWRSVGGCTLSLHLTELIPNDRQKFSMLHHLAQTAVFLGCNRTTLHVPYVDVQNYPVCRDRLLDHATQALAPLCEASIAIGIENLHCAPGDTPLTRRFGCTIAECREWLELLRDRLDYRNLGFHLDLGHARNNRPLSDEENLSHYYAELGHEINGFHLHQVIQQPDGSFRNHQPLTGFYDKLISLAGLFMAWRTHQVNHAPMFLEIAGESQMMSYKILSKKLGEIEDDYERNPNYETATVIHAH